MSDADPLSESMWETVPRLLAQHHYLVLGTVDDDGGPWVTPLFFAADGDDRVVWVSSPASRHSGNLGARPSVAITLFDTHAPIGGAEAVYLEATAAPVDDGALPAALALLNTRLPARQQLGPDEVGPGTALRAYAATVHRHSVLIRGGDPRFDNVTDARLTVEPP
jgi:predicted pyridoxine 5'-phosphate oxidase superfamily flavin-nucleotide-binding protein